MFAENRPEPTKDRKLLFLVYVVRKLKENSYSYVKILRLLYAFGIRNEYCRDVFSRAFSIDYFRTKVIMHWHPDFEGNGRMKHDEVEEDIARQIAWVHPSPNPDLNN